MSSLVCSMLGYLRVPGSLALLAESLRIKLLRLRVVLRVSVNGHDIDVNTIVDLELNGGSLKLVVLGAYPSDDRCSRM